MRVVPFQTVVPHLTKFLPKSHRLIYKRKKIEKFKRKGGTKILSLRKRMKLLKKERVIWISIKIGIIINLKHLSKEYYQLSVVPLRENAKIVIFSYNILKTLRMTEFNYFNKKG